LQQHTKGLLLEQHLLDLSGPVLIGPLINSPRRAFLDQVLLGLYSTALRAFLDGSYWAFTKQHSKEPFWTSSYWTFIQQHSKSLSGTVVIGPLINSTQRAFLDEVLFGLYSTALKEPVWSGTPPAVPSWNRT